MHLDDEALEQAQRNADHAEARRILSTISIRDVDTLISVSKYWCAVDALQLVVSVDAWRDPWCSDALTKQAAGLLEEAVVSREDAMYILTQYIRPIFRTQNKAVWDDEAPMWTSTRAVQGHVPLGCHNVLAWLMSRLGPVWDEAWPLVIPPIMTWLDASMPQAKICGACTAYLLVRYAPRTLLSRAGIDRLLEASLTRMLSFMTDAQDGPMILSAALQARLAIVSRRPVDDQFEGQCTLFSETVLTALSYCAPASSSTYATRPSDPSRTATLSSPRLQQVLACTACTWAVSLFSRMGDPCLRFWNAWMDWTCAWLQNALSISPRPLRPVTEMVDELVERGHLEHTSPSVPGKDAMLDLLQSLYACTEATRVLVDLAKDARVDHTPLPRHPPGLSAWSARLLTATCRCIIRLEDLSLDVALSSSLLTSLRALCDTLLEVEPALGASLRALAPTRLGWLTQKNPRDALDS